MILVLLSLSFVVAEYVCYDGWLHRDEIASHFSLLTGPDAVSISGPQKCVYVLADLNLITLIDIAHWVDQKLNNIVVYP